MEIKTCNICNVKPEVTKRCIVCKGITRLFCHTCNKIIGKESHPKCLMHDFRVLVLLKRLVAAWNIMALICKGYCEELKGPSMRNGLRYASGQKRCTLCNVFLITPSLRCPCCSSRLRTKSRSSRSKKSSLNPRL